MSSHNFLMDSIFPYTSSVAHKFDNVIFANGFLEKYVHRYCIL